MFKTIIHVMALTVQNYSMKLFCLLVIVIPFSVYAFGFNEAVKHGLLAMPYLAIVWALTPFFISSNAIEQAVEEINKINEQE